MFHKGAHKHCFAYKAHTVCDKHNFILNMAVTSGNVHGSSAFDVLYDKISGHFPETGTIVMNVGYKTICKRIFDDRMVPALP